MTTYFDNAHTLLRDARVLGGEEMIETFDAVEKRVVFDCTVAAMLPGFPADLKKPLHELVLKHGVQMLPVNAPPADFETEDDHYRRLNDLVWHLHSVFHTVAERALENFNDNPLQPLRCLYAKGEEEREGIVASERPL